MLLLPKRTVIAVFVVVDITQLLIYHGSNCIDFVYGCTYSEPNSIVFHHCGVFDELQTHVRRL